MLKNPIELLRNGFKLGKRAFVRPFSCSLSRFLKIIRVNWDKYKPDPAMFYNNITLREIQIACYYMSDDEPAGVKVDM